MVSKLFCDVVFFVFWHIVFCFINLIILAKKGLFLNYGSQVYAIRCWLIGTLVLLSTIQRIRRVSRHINDTLKMYIFFLYFLRTRARRTMSRYFSSPRSLHLLPKRIHPDIRGLRQRKINDFFSATRRTAATTVFAFFAYRCGKNYPGLPGRDADFVSLDVVFPAHR